MKHISRKFNPGLNEDDADIINNYVVRLPLFEILLETIEQNISRDICQHRFYHAPRGRGKTMLLARLSAALRTEKRFKNSCIPVQLFEENFYEINNIAEFWLEILNTMQTTLDDSSTSIAQRIEFLLNQWQHPNIGQIAEQAVIEEMLDRDKKAVIMVENMHQLLDEVEDDNSFSADLRRVMQNQPQLMFVLTATTQFAQLSNANHPFYELFAITEIPPLTRAETFVLWNYLTNCDDQEDQQSEGKKGKSSGHSAANDSIKQENKIAPLHILTGGSPRLLRIMASFGSNHCIRDLLENLSGLIDEHTEYFKSQIDALPTKERRVFIALADLWQDSTAGEIANRARMDVRSTASLLNRLVHRGAIRINTAKKRNKTYLVSERLFSIYYKFRRQRQPESVAKHLIEFMVDFYTTEDVDNIIHKALKEMSLSSLEQATLDGLQTAYNAQLKARKKASRTTPGIDDHRAIPPKLLKKTNAAFDALTKGNYKKAISLYSSIIAQYGQSKEPALQELLAKTMFTLGISYAHNGEADEAIAQYSALIKRFESSKESALQKEVAIAILALGGIYGQQGQTDEAIAQYLALIKRFEASKDPALQEWVAPAMFFLGDAYGQQGETRKEIAQYSALIKHFGTSKEPVSQDWVATAMLILGDIYPHQDEVDKAIVEYSALIKRLESSEEPALQEQVAYAMFNLGSMYSIIRAWPEAISSFGRLQTHISKINGDPSWRPLIRSNTLLAQKLIAFSQIQNDRSQGYIAAVFKKSIDLSSTEERMTLALACAAFLSTQAALEGLEDDTHDEEIAPIAIAVKMMNELPVRGSEEMREIAVDVIERIESLREEIIRSA